MGNPAYVYKLGMSGHYDVGDPECVYKFGMARQMLHPDVEHPGDINKVSPGIVTDNLCVVRVAGVSDEGGADGMTGDLLEGRGDRTGEEGRTPDAGTEL